MVEELKTLKEIWETGGQSYSYMDIRGVGLDDLKAEAVKWMKMLDKKIEQGIAYNFPKSKVSWKGQRDFIEMFFNLTEEDLK